MSIKDTVSLFEFVVQEVHRLRKLRQTNPKQAIEEIGLHRGLPTTYDDFPPHYFECGEAAAYRLYEFAEARLPELPELKGRVTVETFLKPIEVELAQRALAKQAKVDEAMVREILRTAQQYAKARLEDRTYLFPVYAVEIKETDEFVFGGAKFVRAQRFLAENESAMQRSADAILSELPAWQKKNPESLRSHLARMFAAASEHYGKYRWIAAVEIAGAEPDVAWKKARDVLEQSLNLLRLGFPSRERRFIGLIEDCPVLSSVSHLSLKRPDEFCVWHSSSFVEPVSSPEYIQSYRQRIPYLECLESAIRKVQRWETPDAIEDRLLTALFWFGEAWKQTRLLPKIVNFSNCVESLFGTGDREGITEMVAERLAWLSFPDMTDRENRRETFDDMRKVYSARSKAVHGDSAVKKFDLPSLARKAEELASLGVFACAQLPALWRVKGDEEQLLKEFFTRLKLEGKDRALLVLQDATGTTE